MMAVFFEVNMEAIMVIQNSADRGHWMPIGIFRNYMHSIETSKPDEVATLPV